MAYYESFVYPDAAIRREKEVKGGRRSKKIKLVESMNPRWKDLGRDWQNLYKPDEREIPRAPPESAAPRDDTP